MGQTRVVKNISKRPLTVSDTNVNGIELAVNKKVNLLVHASLSSISSSTDLISAIDAGYLVVYDSHKVQIKSKSEAKYFIKFGMRYHEDCTTTSIGTTTSSCVGGTINRVAGDISSVALDSGVTYVFNRDVNGISSIANGTCTWTFIRDIDGIITSWTVA